MEHIPKAVLVALVTQKQDTDKTTEYLDELEFLTETLGVITLKRFTQRLERPDHSFFIGKGKMFEIKDYIQANEIDMVIFDDDLTPAQAKNLEKAFEIKILDRSLLILEIFLKRAKTSQARTQVALARNQYLLPRLTGMWTHLERQRGGTGTRGGAGEKEIETDRRVVRVQISLLKEKLEKIDKQKMTQRKQRSQEVRVALVGYTNVGKSTLMNLLSKADVFAENKLFATIDSTVRKVVLDEIPFLLTDTVGFIRKLPHQLIECFKSTLDEVREADILIQVVDLAHPSYEEHMQVVKDTLAELGAGDKTVITVFNKIDALSTEPALSLEELLSELKSSHPGIATENAVFISAAKRWNMAELREKISASVKARYYLIYPNYLEKLG